MQFIARRCTTKILLPYFAPHIHSKDYNASIQNLLLNYLFKQSGPHIFIQTERVTTFSAFLFRSNDFRRHNLSSEKKKRHASGIYMLKNNITYKRNTVYLPGVTEKDLFISKDDDRE